DGDRLRIEFREIRGEDTAVGGVEKAQTNSLTGFHDENLVAPTVDRDHVAPAAVVHEAVPCVELGIDLRIGADQPVIEYPEDVARIRRGLRVLHDQYAVETALDLLARTDVGMEPEGASIFRDEVVDKGLARANGRLGDIGNAVHRIRDADAVPVDGRVLR